MPAEQSDQPAASNAETQSPSAAITPEMVKEVAEKVYALMLRDLKIARERQRGTPNANTRKGA